jgi:hypothetical protein
MRHIDARIGANDAKSSRRLYQQRVSAHLTDTSEADAIFNWTAMPNAAASWRRLISVFLTGTGPHGATRIADRRPDSR